MLQHFTSSEKLLLTLLSKPSSNSIPFQEGGKYDRAKSKSEPTQPVKFKVMAGLGKKLVQSCIQRTTGFPWHGVVCTGVHFNAHAQYVANQHRSIRDKVRYKQTAELKVYLKVSQVQENRKSTFGVVSSHGWWICINFQWHILIVLVESVFSLQHYHFSDQHFLAMVLSPALPCPERLSSQPAGGID